MRRKPALAYASAAAALAGAVLLRLALDPVLGDTLPLVTLFGAVAAAVWLGGIRAAAGAAVVGYLACAYLFIEPRGELGLDRAGNVVGFVAYLFTCALVIGFGQAMRVAQARAGEQGEVFRVTLRSIGDAVITTDNQGRITYLNAVAESLTGWTATEAEGQGLHRVFRIVNEETRGPVEDPAARALREGIVVGLANHSVLIRRDGSERPIDDSAAPIRNESGVVSGCVLIFRDVTELRSRERERASQLLAARVLASIVETSDDAIIGKTLQGVIQSWNAAAERLFGYSAAEAVGRHISLIIPPDRLAEEDQIIASLKAGRRIDHFETERVGKDGRRLVISLSVSPIKDDAGRVVGASKIVRDVTRQRLAEERERQLLAEAAAATAKFQAFFEQGPLFAGIMAVDGTLLDANQLSLEGCGYTKEQVVGKPFWEGPWWAPSPTLAARIEEASARAAGGETFRAEMSYFVADGSERVVDVSILPIRDETGRVVFLAPTGSDITDRKRAEADRERFAAIIESSTDFIGIWDLNGTPFFVNRAGLQMVGLSSIEEARARPVVEFFFPEDRPRILEEFFPAVLEKGHGEIEVRFRHFKTGDARWMAYKVLTVKDPTGQPVALATVSQDVTLRKSLENSLRSLADDLSEADRRKDVFLAMLAHELRNPLAAITNAVQILRRAGNDGEALHAASGMLERQVGQVTRLVDDLLDMSRITQGKIELRREPVELAPILDQAVEAAQALCESRNQQLTVTRPARPVHLQADATRLAQVVGNLLSNASKFTDDGGGIDLSVENDGREAVIRVRDTGIGIGGDELPRLFDMFTQVDSSLERTRDGLGIGLTLVKALVEMHGGTVEAKSEGLGRGSEFVVRLPILADPPKPVAGEPVGLPPRRVRRRVLIVDDNEDSAESLAILLQLRGHETYTAHDGLSAMEAAERLDPDVVLLDIGLPRLSGYDVCRRLREQPWGKDLALVAVTGWGQQEDRRRSREAGFDNHIVKPIDHNALMQLLATLPKRARR